MNPMLLQLMSGPLAALLRYGIAAGATWITANHYLPGGVVGELAGYATAAVPAVIGALTSTRSAAVTKVAAIEGAKVVLPNGRTVDSAASASNATTDPTWSNPNAR